MPEMDKKGVKKYKPYHAVFGCEAFNVMIRSTFNTGFRYNSIVD
jgi:hypothetical protein